MFLFPFEFENRTLYAEMRPTPEVEYRWMPPQGMDDRITLFAKDATDVRFDVVARPQEGNPSLSADMAAIARHNQWSFDEETPNESLVGRLAVAQALSEQPDGQKRTLAFLHCSIRRWQVGSIPGRLLSSDREIR